MRASHIIAGVFWVIVAIISYYAFQKISRNIKLESFIRVKEKDVFNYIKDPKHLPELLHSVKDVRIHNLHMEKDAEVHDFTAKQKFNHIGDQVVTVHMLASEENMAVTVHMATCYGIVQGTTRYTLQETIHDEGVGTVVTEDTVVVAPRAMLGFFNRTVVEYHREMLDNLKLILEEGWYDMEVT